MKRERGGEQMYMYMLMSLYMSEADNIIILHVCVELMLNRCTLYSNYSIKLCSQYTH